MKKFGVILVLNKMKSGAKREWFLFILLFLREREICEKSFSKRAKFFCSRAAFNKSSFFAMLRLLKNLSGTDISQPGSRVLRRPGSSLGSID